MNPIRFASYLAPNMLPVYRFIADYLADRLGCPVEMVTGSAFGQFASREVDVGFICGLPYVHLARLRPAPVEVLAAPVLQGERYQGKPVYFSDVIVRRDSRYLSFADLRGCRWSYNDPESQSGYGITLYWLYRMQETQGFFGSVIAAGYHQRSIRMVCAGEVDASAIDSQVLAVELRDHPELAARLRVVDSLGPSTIQPVVAAAHLPAGLKGDLRAALLEMGDDPVARERLSYGFMERFVPVSDSDYDDIRQMLAQVEAAGFTTIR